MKIVLKWLAIVLGALLLLAAVASAGVYVVSENAITKSYDRAGTAVPVPTDSASIAEGKRLARIRGCYQGCHGAKGLEGGVFFDEPGIAKITAPNLTRLVRQYSNADLERAIRHGVRRNGRPVFAMPSAMFYHLSDRDLGAILAFIRSEPQVEGPDGEMVARPIGRIGIVAGKYDPQVAQIDEREPRMVVDPADSVSLGKYLVTTVCTECHGPALRGEPGGPANLHVAMPNYSGADFATLMKTGTGMGKRELGLMTEVAKSRFAYFTDAEVRAVYAYLRSLPPEPAGE